MKTRRKAKKNRLFKGDLLKGAHFLALFLVLFALSYFVLSAPVVRGFFAELATQTSKLALSAVGIQTQQTFLENGNHALENENFIAELNETCAAIVEIAVLFGIVFASFEKTLKERVKGFAAGMALLLVFNPIRISLSVIFLDPLVHDVLFRIMLILVIIVFYALWYYGFMVFEKKFWAKRIF